MTYTFTPEQAAALATVPVDVTAYLAVKGEPWCHGCERPHPPNGCHYCGNQPPLHSHPPADLAALVEQRCKRCDGSGAVGDKFDALDCPLDCHDGKPLHGLWTYDALLLVVGNMQGREPDRPCVEVWSPSYTREWYLHPKWGTYFHRQITVCGTPKPGHYVLAVTRRAP